MQLKMNNKFNVKLTKEILQEENRFIGDLFSKMPLPMADLEDMNAESDDDEENSQRKKAKLFTNNGKAKRAQTFEELHEKLSGLKGQKKLTYKQKQLKKGLKNRLKKKTKREVRLLQKQSIKKEEGDDENVCNDDSNSMSEKKDAIELPKVSRAKPVFNSDGNMVFSKFDFSEIGTKKKMPKVESDPKKILEQLKERKEKLKTLVDSGEKDKAQELIERDAWKNVLARANGAKVKDDPDLLKRTIKRDESQKRRSAKKWESRISAVEKAKQEKQNKRQDNIMARKKDKKNNKLKKSSKKGRIIPGF